MPTFDANGNIINAEADFLEVSNLSGTGFNGVLVPLMDLGAYRRFSLQITGTWVGTIVFQACNTGNAADLKNISVINVNNGSYGFNTTTNGIFAAAINFRYLQVSFSPWTSGTATGTLELYYSASTLDPVAGLQLQNASVISPAGSDQNGTMLQVSLYGKSTNPGDTPLALSTSGLVKVQLQASALNTTTIGMINNDGVSNVAVAAGVTTDTVIKNSAGRLAGILVTAAGTGAMNIYDNATAGLGTIIGIVKSTAVVGDFSTLKAPATNGITVKGAAANPGVTIFYT